ncbi:hypothetical protein [Methylocucumis oryzae]|uniref:hypothetical protein n=1 Tax=Methylocucumis oryzae TaxID=1632867 RepID=UPI001EF9D8E1|nr:hypothetical protein [Methylocucumis oryzae]
MSVNSVQTLAEQSRVAARQLAVIPEALRNLALANMAEALAAVKHEVLAVNAEDVVKAKDEGQSEAMVKRLTIDEKTFQYMLSS